MASAKKGFSVCMHEARQASAFGSNRKVPRVFDMTTAVKKASGLLPRSSHRLELAVLGSFPSERQPEGSVLWARSLFLPKFTRSLRHLPHSEFPSLASRLTSLGQVQGRTRELVGRKRARVLRGAELYIHPVACDSRRSVHSRLGVVALGARNDGLLEVAGLTADFDFVNALLSALASPLPFTLQLRPRPNSSAAHRLEDHWLNKKKKRFFQLTSRWGILPEPPFGSRNRGRHVLLGRSFRR